MKAKTKARIASFLAYLEFQRNASAHTLAAYGEDLRRFGEFLGETPLEKADYQTLRRFLAVLKDEEYTPASIGRKVAALKSFFRHLARTREIPADPALLLHSPRLPERLPNFLTCEEAGKIVEAPEGASAAALRDRAILELLYGAGLRVSELTGLRAADVCSPRGGSASGARAAGSASPSSTTARARRSRSTSPGARPAARAAPTRRRSSPTTAGRPYRASRSGRS